MKLFSKIVGLASTLLVSFSAFASIPNTNHPKTFLGPYGQAQVNTTMGDLGAFSVLAEAGPQNYRLNGTMGWSILCNQRVKVSAEYLRQNITYAFYSGNTNQWVQQGALGAEYQYDFEDYEATPQFDISAYYSHAPSKTLSTVTGSFQNGSNLETTYTDVRRIAGSNAAGISPGINVEPWQGGNAGISLNYDNVRYDTLYSTNHDAKGLGGTVHFNQNIDDDIEFGVSAAVRKPFNSYQANLNWLNVPLSGSWVFGLNGTYTVGKQRLPTTYNVGVSADYYIDQTGATSSAQKQQIRNLLMWVAKPAIYMPQVLAIADERVSTSVCVLPTFSGQIGSGDPIEVFAGSTINLSTYFSGPDLTYTINGPNTSGLTIVGNTLEVDDFITRSDLTVTATNSCGSATSNVFGVTPGA